MKYFIYLCFLIYIQGCVQSTVGGAKHKEYGVEVKSSAYCMGNCLAKTADGLHCARFSEDIAETCKEYLK